MRPTFLQKGIYYFSSIIYTKIQVEENLFSLIIFNFWSFVSATKLTISAQVQSCIQIFSKCCPGIEMLEKTQQKWPVLNHCELKKIAHWIFVLH